MMPIIEVENLSKRYLVGHQADTSSHYIALRDVIARGFREFVRKTPDMVHGHLNWWAHFPQKVNVTPEVHRGIIGKSGANPSGRLLVAKKNSIR